MSTTTTLLTADDLDLYRSTARKLLDDPTRKRDARNILTLLHHITALTERVGELAVGVDQFEARWRDCEATLVAMAKRYRRLLDDVTDALGLDPNAWDTEGGEEQAHDAILHAVRAQQEREWKLQAVLVTLLTGAEQQSQSHVDVIVTCRAALGSRLDTARAELERVAPGE